MLKFSRLGWYFAVIAVAFFGCEFALKILDRGDSCTVVITGESVKIIGCEFTDKFIEYAKDLKPARHW